MSRDQDHRPTGEQSRPVASGGGSELSSGGRSAGGKRPGPAKPRDPREILSQQLELPRGKEREAVQVGERSYQLRSSEVRLLAAVGAFRVVDTQDFKVADRWSGDVEHLRRAGLVDVSSQVLNGHRTAVVALTREGQQLLERHQRSQTNSGRQVFYAGVVKPRELAHDAQLYRAYAAAVAKLYGRGATIRRVVLDYELKGEYQRFLQANNRAHRRSSGRPDRSRDEIQAWAEAHHLPVVDGHVQFPDVRVEYEQPDGQRGREDIEVTTADYNGQQLAAKRASGFTMHGSRAGRLGGSQRSGGSPFDPHAAEQVLR